jgi:hypothetical protein
VGRWAGVSEFLSPECLVSSQCARVGAQMTTSWKRAEDAREGGTNFMVVWCSGL